jgi:hypothetical protein
MYTMNVRIRIAPPNRPRFWKKRMKSVNSVVRPSSTPVYILADLSNVVFVGEKMRPRENAPRMFEIEDPTMFPIARGDSC